MSCLRNHSVLEASFASGLSGAGRLHDLLIKFEGMTPGEYKERGRGLDIKTGSHPTPFGRCFIATTPRGICHLSFFDTEKELRGIQSDLKSEWPLANFAEDQKLIEELVGRIFYNVKKSRAPLHVLMKGSEFKLKVWEALLTIPQAELVSYQEVARRMGQPAATRAVASAIASNEISYLIPCHRVIRSSGEFNNYRWGATRKKAMVAWELSRAAKS